MPVKLLFSVRLVLCAALAAAVVQARPASACDGAPRVSVKGPKEVVAALAQRHATVLTFFGYSAAEYQDRSAMLAQAARVLARHDPARTIVVIGATEQGVGAVYTVAKAKGFRTVGIVSVLARDTHLALSPCVDDVFFVPDAAWGGLDAKTGKLSPTSQAMVESSDLLVGIGGGEVTRDEMAAGKRMGKPIEFTPAEMNHAIAIKRAADRGLPPPTDFQGSAAAVFAPKK
jgi:predicted Rossmann-fold nucleotide-binding protein